MIRKIEILGVALAALALMAIAASGASAAPGTLKSDGPFVMDGSDGGGASAFTFPGAEVVECPESSAAAEAVGGGALKESGETEFTVGPIYNNAKCHTNNNRKVTVLDNGCHYVIHIGETVAADRYASTVDLACPAGKSFEIEVFFSSSNENLRICTIAVASQKGWAGPAIISETANQDIRVEGKFEGIAASKSGACGAETTAKAERDLSLTFIGTRPGEAKETIVSVVD